MSSKTLTGGCLCGAIRYEFDYPTDKPPTSTHCHCNFCRKTTGSYFETFVPTTLDALRWMTESRPKEYQKSALGKRGFCPECGSPLTWVSSDNPKRSMCVTVGSLDDADAVKGNMHIFYERVANAAKGVEPSLPKYTSGE
ncbi:Mss4-like protein [Jimgerdemannia flammicorona]|uniref:Mss4-like protein n=2 Tax=Jimgerdemannia flammicorona TaxID=994334 RepID=A0A433QAT2_9FUNG|nr:Mss4-like protein [Jimgerdemannia flammicorona]RUS26897.1 Mss4-like protein [Jimgerdemannia flammicorona]